MSFKSGVSKLVSELGKDILTNPKLPSILDDYQVFQSFEDGPLKPVVIQLVQGNAIKPFLEIGEWNAKAEKMISSTAQSLNLDEEMVEIIFKGIGTALGWKCEKVQQSSKPVIEEKKAPRRTTSQRQTSTTSSKAKTDSGKTEQTRTTGNQSSTRRRTSTRTSTSANTGSTTSTRTPTRTSSSNRSPQSYTASDSNSSSFWTSFGEILTNIFKTLWLICICIGFTLSCGLILLLASFSWIDVNLYWILAIALVIGIILTYYFWETEFAGYMGCFGAVMLALGIYILCAYKSSEDKHSDIILNIKEGNVATFSCDTKALYFSQEVIDSLGWKEGDKIAYQPCYDYGDSCLINIDIAKVYEDYKTNMEELTKYESGYCINFGFDITAYGNNQVSIKMKEKIHDNEVHFDRLERKTDKMYNVPDSVVSYTIYVSE